MKVGIVGTGYVGATAGYAMVMSGVGRDIVLVDLNRDRAVAEADDIRHGKGATYYGIGGALARIVDVNLLDQRAIMSICTPAAEVAGVNDVTLSLPRLLGGQGVLETFPLPLNDEETALLGKSAKIIRGALDEISAS